MLRVVIVLALLLQGCSLLGFDHRANIANATLFKVNGVLDEQAFVGALLGKFPIHSASAGLRDYVSSLGGHCGDSRVPKHLFCSIPVSGTLCAANNIDIDVRVSNGSIEGIAADQKGETC